MASRRAWWAGAALATVVLVGTAGTGATWVDQATMPGGEVRTVEVQSPAPTCSVVGLKVDVSWSTVPFATGYVVLVGGLPVAHLPTTTLSYGGLALGSLVTVEATFGAWTSSPSIGVTC